MKEDKRTYELLSTCIVDITSNRWMRVQHSRDSIFLSINLFHTETLYHPSLSPIPKPMWLRSNTIRYKFVFVGKFFVPLETFLLIWRRHRATYFYVYSWQFSSEGSLTCHTYCDTDIYCETGQPFTMIISEDPWHSYLLPSVWHWRCHYPFNDVRLSWPGIEPRSPACDTNALPLRHHGVTIRYNKHFYTIR